MHLVVIDTLVVWGLSDSLSGGNDGILIDIDLVEGSTDCLPLQFFPLFSPETLRVARATLSAAGIINEPEDGWGQSAEQEGSLVVFFSIKEARVAELSDSGTVN